jgi:hypothetical protein
MMVRPRILAAMLAALAATVPACGRDAPVALDDDVLRVSDGAVTALRADGVSPWSPAIRVEDIPGTNPKFNYSGLDGCPFIAADDRTFYMASDRPGGLGGIDIWVVTRPHRNAPWGEPVNVGAPINTEYNDFCPTLASDLRTFYFASNRPGGCGADDLYVTRRNPVGRHRDEDDDDASRAGGRNPNIQWEYAAPTNLGCAVNSPASEHGPSPVYEPGTGLVLYFSSFRAGGFAPDLVGAVAGDADLYRSVWRNGAFGQAELVPGVNTEFADGQPNIRRDAKELFFYSNRTGTLGGNDLYSASRHRVRDAWSTPVNLGPSVNSASSETRPSLSRDGLTLYFGSDRPGPTAEGGADHYLTTRSWRRDRDD